MKRKLILSLLLMLLVALCTVFGACSLFGNSGDGTSDKEGAELIKVGSATPVGNEVYLLVDREDWYDLVKVIEVSEGALLKIYYDEDCTDEIKDYYLSTVSLSNGNNIFYLRVTSGNTLTTNTYKLTAYKSYGVAVFFYDGDQLLKIGSADTGMKFTPAYIPELVGYTFSGWLDEENNAFTSGVLWDSIFLYASKTPIKYKATLDTNGGDSLQDAEAFIDYNSDFTLPVAERYGYDFAGWYVDDTQITDEAGKSTDAWNFTEDTALTARWTLKTFNIRLENEDPSAGSVSGDWAAKYGDKAEITATPKDGYSFVGWYDEEGELITLDTRYEFEVLKDRTFTAKWDVFTLTIRSETGGKVSRVYTVKFDLNGGNGTVPETQYVSAFQPLKYPTEKAPTRSDVSYPHNDYVFRGWFTKRYPTDDDVPYDFSAEVNSDMTLYAGWYGYPQTADITVMPFNWRTTINLSLTGPNNPRYVYFCPDTTGVYSFEYESWQTELFAGGVSLLVYNKTDSNAEVFKTTFNDTKAHTEDISVKAGNVYCIDVRRERNSGAEDYFVAVGLSSNGAKPAEGGVVSPLAPETPITSGTELVLAATAEEGYEFLGWYDESGELVSTELIYEVTMPYATKEFTAKWRLIP